MIGRDRTAAGRELICLVGHNMNVNTWRKCPKMSSDHTSRRSCPVFSNQRFGDLWVTGSEYKKSTSSETAVLPVL